MTFDGNPKPVQFIQPNALDRACFSAGKHDSFADQFRIAPHRPHSKFLTHGASPMALLVHVRPNRLCCPKRLNGDACPNAQPLERLMVTALPIRGAGRFVFYGSPGIPALLSGPRAVSPRSLE